MKKGAREKEIYKGNNGESSNTNGRTQKHTNPTEFSIQATKVVGNSQRISNL